MFDRIRQRLTLGYVGILALILLVFSVVIVLAFRETNARQHDRLLVKEAEMLSDTVSSGQSMGDITMSGESDQYSWVNVTPGGRVLFQDDTAPALGLPAKGAAQRALRERTTVFSDSRGPGGEARVVSVPVARSGTAEGVVQVGRSLEMDRQAVNSLVLVLVPIGLGALALAGVGGLFMSQRALRPVREAFQKQRTFIADASHELKTPLSLAKLDGEVLLDEPDAPDAGEIRVHQLSEIDRMSALLSNLLVLARIDAGKLEMERKPFDLAAVLVESTDRFRTRAGAASISLEVSVPGKLPVRGDAIRTGQILAVLLDNALRFTPGGGSITASGRVRDGRIEASIADTGPGVATEHLPHIFDRFYRAEAARTRTGGGTGLGLSIARDFARAQGGELTVESPEGAGATFRLTCRKA